MKLTALSCPECNSEDHKFHTSYTIDSGERREIRLCKCGNYFSETKNTPIGRIEKTVKLNYHGFECPQRWDEHKCHLPNLWDNQEEHQAGVGTTGRAERDLAIVRFMSPILATNG